MLLKGNWILSIKRDPLHPLGEFSHFAIPQVDTFSIAIPLEIYSDNRIDARRRNREHTRKGPGRNTVHCIVRSTSSHEYFTRTHSVKPVTGLSKLSLRLGRFGRPQMSILSVRKLYKKISWQRAPFLISGCEKHLLRFCSQRNRLLVHLTSLCASSAIPLPSHDLYHVPSSQ